MLFERILEGHLPYPAVVVRGYGELVAANTAVGLLTADAPPELLEPPINVLRLSVHPNAMGSRVENLAEWGRHIVESLRARALQSPDPQLDAFAAELEGYLPAIPPGSSHLGFAVPLRLRTDEGELRLDHDAHVARDGSRHHTGGASARSLPALQMLIAHGSCTSERNAIRSEPRRRYRPNCW